MRFGPHCDAKPLVHPRIEKLILETIHQRFLSPDGAIEMRKRAAELRDYSQKLDTHLRERRDRLARTEEKMRGLADFIASGERSSYIVKTLQDHETFAEQLCFSSIGSSRIRRTARNSSVAGFATA